MFDRLGEIVFPRTAGSEEDVLEAAIEAGAQDTESDDDGHVILTAFEDLTTVAEAVEARLGPPTSAQIVWRAKSETPVTGQDAATLVKLISALEDDDDVQSVWTNAGVDEAEMAQLSG
jgi:transcriptional/translational regulatory protein YebC/TACO1